MNKEELILEVAKYIISNWQSLIVGTASFLASLVGITWLVAKHWYEREIKLCKTECNATSQIHDKELRHLTRQIDDRNFYAQGIIEVMNQRLHFAKEEPQRLLNIIWQHENQLAVLKKENAKLLSEVKAVEYKSRDKIFWYSLFDTNDIKTELNNICKFNIDFFSKNDDISILCEDYFNISSDYDKNDLDLKAIVPIVILLLKAQSQKIASLDVGLAKCNKEYNKMHTYYYKSTVNILKPILSNNLDKKYFTLDTKHISPLINILKDKMKIYYLDWLEEDEADGEPEEDT